MRTSVVWRARAHDVVAGAILTAVTFAVRLWTLRTIDLGGDATFKWFFVRTWAYDNPWIFDHHTARFSINVPIWLVQKLLGPHPNGMYVAPLLAAVVQAPLLYAGGVALGMRAAGVIACALVLVFEPMVDASSQLLPGIFQATYLLAALYALLRFARAPASRLLWLSGCFLFLGHLAMLTTLFVLPGIAIGVWCVRRKLRDAGHVIGTFAVLVACETVAYAALSKYRFGQFQLVEATHTNVVATGFWGLFRRYTELSRDWQAVLVAFGVCVLGWLAIRIANRRARNPGSEVLWLAPVSILAGMTFGVKGIDPIVPATTFRIRYFDVLVPLIALCLGVAMVGIARRLLGARTLPRSRVVLPLTAAVAIAGAGWFASTRYAPPGAHTLTVTSEHYSAINAALEQNVPIVAMNRSEHFQMKTLTCVEWAFEEDRFLLRDGQLQVHKRPKAPFRRRTQRYLALQDPGREVVARFLREGRCHVAVTRQDVEPKLLLRRFEGTCDPNPR